MNNKKIVDDVELNYSLCSEIDIFFIPVTLKNRSKWEIFLALVDFRRKRQG